ncbi:MAG: cytochrome bc1 complex diheme cytochrome c subunit [Nocardioidaceae bacterium]
MRFLTARLSAKRRSRFAGPVVLLLGLLATGAAYAAFAPANAASGSYDSATVAKGRGLFLVGCASCHGQNGEGVVTQRGTQYGPPLVGVGAAAVDFQVGTGRMPMARPGVQAAQKPVAYTPEEVRELAAFVATLGPGPAIPLSSQYDATNATNEEIVRGGQLFLTNCTACHNFAASGGALPEGKFAPTLKGVDPKYIYEAMLIGPQQMPVFSDAVMTPPDKRDIIAYLNSIQTQPKYGGAGLGSLGPVSEGLFAWIVGIGACVLGAIWIASKGARS